MATRGTLILAATPIGDMGDASPRLREVLASADIVAAEDTRRLRRLTAALEIEISGRVVAYHEHSEGARTRQIVDQLLDGATVVLVTDAGMPSISDPGFRLVSAAIDADVLVTAIPGPSAVLTSLALSGLAVDRFCFEGFLPRKSGQRRERLRDLAGEPRTMVFFEAPHRLAEVLADAAELLGPTRAAAVCREMTKTYEEVKRGSLEELAKWAQEGVRGEITLVVAGGVVAPPELSDADLRDQVRDQESTGRTRKDAIAIIAAATGLPKRRVYNAAHQPPTERP